MKNRNQKEFILKAIPLWEVGAFFFVLSLAFLGILEYVLIPLKASMRIIFFVLCLIFSLEYVFHLKRARGLSIKIDDLENITEIKYSDRQIFNNISNINIVRFLFKRTLTHTLIINNNLFLIYKKESILTKSDKKEIKIEMDNLAKIIRQSKFPKYSPLNVIPKSINIAFYSLFIIAFSLFIFLFTAIFTDNTNWFNFFK